MKILSNEYLSNLPSGSKVASGGPAHFSHAFSDFLNENGHEWIGIIHQGNDGEKTNTIKKAGIMGKDFYIFSYPHTHRHAFMSSKKKLDPREWFAPQIESLRRLIRRAKPDMLFLNGYSVFAWKLLEAARLEGLPIVIQHAGIAQVEFEQYKDLYTRAARMAVLQMEQDIVEAATKQVFLNEFSRDAFCERVAKVPEHQAVVIPLPYQEIFATHASTKKSAGSEIVIGCVARWDRIKNHQAILRLALEAKKQGLDWHFRSVTKIPETKVHIRFKNSYRKEIEVVAPMSTQDLIKFYKSVDLLVLPSNFDVSPTVVMEAALQYRPTLISKNVGWVSEYRASGIEDWIMDFSDEKKLVQRLHTLLQKPFPLKFRNMVLLKHDPKKVFGMYVKLFSSVV
ncbi:MAG: glycosyltransferase family 4 protein [Candidatus Uhrbacteria bacterium]